LYQRMNIGGRCGACVSCVNGGSVDKLSLMRLIGLVLLACTAPAGDLFRDDFSRFPPGWLSAPVGTLNGAIQEYHYLPHRGVPLSPWFNPFVHQDAWVVSDEDGKPYMEQAVICTRCDWANSMLITGDGEWSGYAVEVKAKPLSLRDATGLVFRYHTNRHFYLFGLRDGKEAVLRLRLPVDKELRKAEWRDLGAVPFAYDTRRYYTLKVENDGPKMRAYVDGKLVLEASDTEILKGKAGVTANWPARFMDFRVSASDAELSAVSARIAKREKELAQLQKENAQPKLWKKFETPAFGAGRNVRFGDLDGDRHADMLIAQNIPRVRGDAFDAISCLTAVTLDGKVLWQQGRPDPRNGLLTNDTPFQIHDIDGDGAAEVVLVRDFQLQILEGKTGRLKKSAWMPAMDADLADRPYELNSGDSLAFVGNRIFVKDRYRRFWIFDADLKLLWTGTGQTGHYPYAYDVDGDGRQEFVLGYAMWNLEGRQLWSRDAELKDHADGIVMGNFSGDAKAQPLVYACGSDEGFLLLDREGKILKHLRIGHAQSPSIAKYRMDIPGLQLLTVNFWWNPGILTLIDWQGNILQQEEPIHTGSPLLPVNWRGDGEEFSMLSGNVREGGMIDGRMRRVVVFPDDGHPDLAFNVMDLTGDARDEIVMWDTQRVWIYTQDRPFTGKRIYAPVRNPDYNESNYRTTVSLPAWRALP
jgi:rhamnogalacturonan endolyase